MFPRSILLTVGLQFQIFMNHALKLLAVVALTPVASAVSTSHWTHTSEAEFAAGTMVRTVATNLGDVKLSRAVDSILKLDARISAVHALAQTADGTIFAATGPQGVLLQLTDGTVSDAAVLGDNVSLFSLLVDKQNRLLIGTGGEQGEVYRINAAGAAPEKIFSAEGVQYVWSMWQADDGTVYLATGPTGQLHAISPDGTSEVIYDGDENNILCLAGDPKSDLLFAGTDPHGLVLRINRRTREVFVVYDAPETEITHLIRSAGGDILAATAQAVEGDSTPQITTEQIGRPEETTGGVPFDAFTPDDPAPPSVPEPPPTEPKPIPKYFSVNVSDAPPADAAPANPPAADAPSVEDAPPAEPGEPPEAATAPADTSDSGGITTPARGALPTAPAAAGNAVYRIDADGFVTELMRSNLAIYALLEQNGTILAGTGNDGQLYQINPRDEETVALAKIDSKQILTALTATDGKVYLGCANRGDIVAVSSGYASSGTYTSPVLDASQISRFGTVHLRGLLPDGTSLLISSRSGNVADSTGHGWSSWTEARPAKEFIEAGAPPARFFQYQLAFASDNGAASAVVQHVSVAYQSPNVAPKISAVRVVAGDTANADSRPKYSISWDAEDPNADAMSFTVKARALPRGNWVTIKEKLTDAVWEWDTRTAADGRYELQVEASDFSSNTPAAGKVGRRTSEPFIVDNTPPVIGDLSAETKGTTATVTANVIDRTSVVAKLEYSVNGSADWQIVLPVDIIADSPKEAYEFILADLKLGAHIIALRATDSAGNAAFATVAVSVVK